MEREAPFLSEQGLETAPDAAVVPALQAPAGRCWGHSAVEPEGVPYGTDATHLEGIPTVVFGPGDIAQAHTADEWVDLAQVEGRAGRGLHCPPVPPAPYALVPRGGLIAALNLAAAGEVACGAGPLPAGGPVPGPAPPPHPHSGSGL